MTVLQRRAGRGLLLAMIDIDQNHLVEFTQWYETEHLYDRQNLPGVLTARRYENVEGGPRQFLARYDMISPKVRETDEYQSIQGTPWTRWIRRFYPRPSITYMFVEMGPASDAAERKDTERSNTRAVHVILMNPGQGRAADLRDWIENVYLAQAVSCPGAASVRLFEEIEGGGGKLLILFDLDSAQAAETAQFTSLPVVPAELLSGSPARYLYREIDQ